MARKNVTKRLVAKDVPTYLAKYFPGGKFMLRGRGNRRDAALFVSLRKDLWKKHLYYDADPDYPSRQSPEWRYRVLLRKFQQDLPLEYSDKIVEAFPAPPRPPFKGWEMSRLTLCF